MGLIGLKVFTRLEWLRVLSASGLAKELVGLVGLEGFERNVELEGLVLVRLKQNMFSVGL